MDTWSKLSVKEVIISLLQLCQYEVNLSLDCLFLMKILNQ